MIQTCSYIWQHIFDANAIHQMRFGGSVNVSPCVNFEATDNQPILRGSKLAERKI